MAEFELRHNPPGRMRPNWKNYRDTAWKVLKSMNVEPALLFFSIQIGIQQTCLQPFLYWRRCTELYMNETAYNIEDFCLHLSDYNDTSMNDEVEADVATFTEIMTVCTSLPAFFLCPIICAWSDAGGGRKPPLLIALAAVVVSHIPYLVCTVIPTVSYYWILLGAIISTMGGSAMVVFATSFSSIADESRMRAHLKAPPPMHREESADPMAVRGPPEPETESEEDKIMTIRIGLGSATFMLGVVFGCLIGTLLRDSDNFSAYYYPFLISEISVFVAFFYVLIFTRETFNPEFMLDQASVDDDLIDGNRRLRSTNPIDVARDCGIGFLKLAEGLTKKLKEAGQVIIAPRAGKKRLLIWIGLTLNFLQMCCTMGVGSLILLFVKRKPLSWTDVQYGYYSAYANAMAALGMTVVPVFVNKAPFLKNNPSKDTIIVMIGCISSACYFSFFAFSATTGMVYASGAFMLFANLFLPGFRSFFSKIVGQEETARIFAAVGMLENFTPMVAALIFTNIYTASLDFNFAGFAFVISAALHIPVFIGMIFIHIMVVKESRNEDEVLVRNMETNEDTSPPGIEPQNPFGDADDNAESEMRNVNTN